MKRKTLQTTKMSKGKNKHLTQTHTQRAGARDLNIFERGGDTLVSKINGPFGKGLSHSKSGSGDINNELILFAVIAALIFFWLPFLSGALTQTPRPRPTHSPTKNPTPVPTPLLNIVLPTPAPSPAPSLAPSAVPSLSSAPSVSSAPSPN